METGEKALRGTCKASMVSIVVLVISRSKIVFKT